MRIVLALSGNLRAILSDLPAEITVESGSPAPLREILTRAGINPLVVVAAAVDGKVQKQSYIIDHDCRIDLIGPAAGG